MPYCLFWLQQKDDLSLQEVVGSWQKRVVFLPVESFSEIPREDSGNPWEVNACFPSSEPSYLQDDQYVPYNLLAPKKGTNPHWEAYGDGG